MKNQLAVARHEFAERIIEEHRHLSETRKRLRNLLEECINHPSEDKQMELEFSLREYRDLLTQHLLLEEKGGFMAPLLEVRPDLAEKVDCLEAEHEVFRSELQGILKEFRVVGELDHPLTDLVVRLGNFLEDVESHERTENGMVLDAFFQDTGNKD